MITDSHIHILPCMDDGSSSVEESMQMLESLKKQGVEKIIATPHFYAHRDKTVEAFLEKREKAYRELGSPQNMLLGAEVAIEHDISKLPGIEKLAIEGTDLILLEFPYTGFASWMGEEIHNIAVTYNLHPVIAHIHRYLSYYSKETMNHILENKMIFQINNEAFGNFRERRFVKKLIKYDYPIIFGSDSHNMDGRKPNWDLLKRKVKPEVIEKAMGLVKKHIR